jgi:hypothetical protein
MQCRIASRAGLFKTDPPFVCGQHSIPQHFTRAIYSNYAIMNNMFFAAWQGDF